MDGIPLAQVDATQLTYLHTDHLGTPRIGTNANANIVWRWDIDPFGESAPNEDPDGDMNSVTVNLRFPGQYADMETGQYYNYFRSYDPSIGRYTTSDPIGLAGGSNTYIYAYGAPVNLSDPTGLAAVYIWNPGPYQGTGGDGNSAGGHAAVATQDGTYVSHHPDQAFTDHSSDFRSYQQDRDAYGRDADLIIYIPLPNEDAASERAKEAFRDPNWSPYGNCVDTTTQILRAGGRRDINSQYRPELLDPRQRLLRDLGVSTPQGLGNYLRGHNHDGRVVRDVP